MVKKKNIFFIVAFTLFFMISNVTATGGVNVVRYCIENDTICKNYVFNPIEEGKYQIYPDITNDEYVGITFNEDYSHIDISLKKSVNSLELGETSDYTLKTTSDLTIDSLVVLQEDTKITLEPKGTLKLKLYGIDNLESIPSYFVIDNKKYSTKIDNGYISISEIKYQYNIVYKLNGGTNNSANPIGYNKSKKTITLKKPTKVGYTFKGWYSDAKYKKKVTSIKKGTKGNKILYAKWEANKYTIKFNSNGGSGKMSNMPKCIYNKSYKLTKNKYTRKGYRFLGWNTKKDGTGTTYANKASIKKLTSKNKGTVTLYAKWEKINYKITYKVNGGTNNSSNPDTYTVTTSTISLKNPTREDYRFKGWYSDAKYKKKVTSIKKGSTGNKTLYAKWEKRLIYRGTGDNVINNIDLPAGNYKAVLTHDGSSNFIVRFYENYSSVYWDLLVNEIGAYAGENVVRDGRKTATKGGALEITADGYWTIEFVKVSGSEGKTITGTSDKVTGYFTGDGKRKTFSFNYEGDKNFIVWAYETKGKTPYLLVSVKGNYSGKKTFKTKKGAKYYFVVTAVGNWTIKR